MWLSLYVVIFLQMVIYICSSLHMKLHFYLLALDEVCPSPHFEDNDDDQNHGDEGAEDDPDHQRHCPRHSPVVLLGRVGGARRHLVTEHIVLVVVALDALARGVVDRQDVPNVDLGGVVCKNPGRICGEGENGDY
jgi:hypothetical protein